ncbi:PspA/IM30 family protein [Paenibacillus sp. GCM10012307]|uniref:PspA/IM30 family protein n=1 Tax=Paenibacillus roseus TaxID=2798579 RepID=A0A934J006_9BACL|nr:PspA/IM30 family protein [Paenibacillus roseus]MBJ6360195.1 PspA/IM30 family protein [Paenibacillus roseus]
MGILGRVKDMTKATLNEVLDKIEDPVIMLNQYVRDMEGEVQAAEVTVARQMTHEQQMKNRYESAVQNAVEAEARAEQAVIVGDEDAARKYLEEKLAYDQQTEQFYGLYEQSKAQAEQLRVELEQMKGELQALRAKRTDLASRAQAAKAKQQLAQGTVNHTIEGGGAVRGFSRMEEKIMQLEAEAEVSRFPGPGAFAPASPAASRDPLKQAQVNEQLEALKQRLGAAREEK